MRTNWLVRIGSSVVQYGAYPPLRPSVLFGVRYGTVGTVGTVTQIVGGAGRPYPLRSTHTSLGLTLPLRVRSMRIAAVSLLAA
eukprot:365314-Chlamydomonas_euryale.AAC.1